YARAWRTIETSLPTPGARRTCFARIRDYSATGVRSDSESMGCSGRTRQEDMETNPPKLVETILGSLIPPACREEVLGDWHERYRSPGQYVWDGIRTLPFLIASQVRGSFSIELFLSQACALYIAFGGASLVGGPAYLYERLLSFAVVI